MEIAPDAAFLLSVGDQIDKSGATKTADMKTRESEYAGYLYPNAFRSLPIASTIGNHDKDGIDYTQHFNNPNSEKNLGVTAAGGDYYFSYGNVLVISLNSNNRNQEEHRALIQEAIESNENAVWKLVIFHSDIYGAGQPHADTDAAQNRIIFAPLMDEFDIDVCLTGHDHTYSRSYQILDGNVIDYDITDGSVTNILAYVGSSINLVMIIYAYSYEMRQIVNMYSIAIELMNGIAGTMGIILAVPFTSMISTVLLCKNSK